MRVRFANLEVEAEGDDPEALAAFVGHVFRQQLQGAVGQPIALLGEAQEAEEPHPDSVVEPDPPADGHPVNPRCSPGAIRDALRGKGPLLKSEVAKALGYKASFPGFNEILEKMVDAGDLNMGTRGARTTFELA